MGRPPASLKALPCPAFPIYWVPQRVGRQHLALSRRSKRSFQFIGFPSEWGVLDASDQLHSFLNVSNLLGSPASGERLWQCSRKRQSSRGFQFIGFPSEWGVRVALAARRLWRGFQFIGFPSEWGVLINHHFVEVLQCFQFIGFPSEWGVHPIKTRMDREWQGAFASISQNRYTLYCF